MIPFDIRRPANLAQLQALYSTGGQDPAAIHGGLGSRGQEFIESSARGMGINDPVAFFQKQRAVALAAATPTLPAQLAARDAAANAALEQEKVAALQLHGGSPFRTALPLAMDNTAELSPLAAKEAARQGKTPLNYALSARTREIGVPMDTNFKTAPTTSSLFSDKNFQNVLRSEPAKAAKVFNAITGGDLHEHMDTMSKTRAAAQAQERTRYISGMESGKLRINPKTGVAEQREMIADPITGKLVPGPNYGEMDTFHKMGWTPEMQSAVLGEHGIEAMHLLMKQAQPDTSPVVAAANPPSGPGPSPAVLAAMQSGRGFIPDAAAAAPQIGFESRLAGNEMDYLGEMKKPFHNIAARAWNATGAKIGGSPMLEYAENPLPLNNETALSILQTPRFKEWQRANPTAAAARVREIIASAYRPVDRTGLGDFDAGANY